MKNFDFFKPGMALAVLAYADKEASLIWFITKLLLVFYLITYLRDAVWEFKRANFAPRKVTPPPEGEEVSKVLYSTPSYPSPQNYLKEDPLAILDMEKTRR